MPDVETLDPDRSPGSPPAWSFEVANLPALIHELRNHLAPIAYSAELLAVLPESSPQVRHAAAVIQRQSARVSRLLDTIDFSTRVFRADFAVVNDMPLLGDVLDDTARGFAMLWPHALTITRPSVDARLEGTAESINWVLLELLDAAAARRHDAPELVLAVILDETDIVMRLDASVSSAAPRVVRAVQRSPLDPGAEMGLACIQQVVRRLGGRIDTALADRDDDGGFILRLRRAHVLADARTAADSVAPGPAWRVLIVDDNPALRESLLHLIAELGHDGRSASSGADALNAATQWQPQVIIIDVNLAGENGYEVADHMRQVSVAGVQIHMMSSEGSGGPLAREAGRRGLTGYIPKMECGPALLRLLPPVAH